MPCIGGVFSLPLHNADKKNRGHRRQYHVCSVGEQQRKGVQIAHGVDRDNDGRFEAHEMTGFSSISGVEPFSRSIRIPVSRPQHMLLQRECLQNL